MNIEMGKTYWKTNNTTFTFDTLKSTLEGFGLIALDNHHLGDEMGFKRVIDWETPTGIKFSTIWYINLCNIRFGDKWENDIAEIMFDSIQGSYGPYCDHDTIDFMYRGNPVLRLALKERKETPNVSHNS